MKVLLKITYSLGTTKIIPVDNHINCYTKDWLLAFLRYSKISYWSYRKNPLLALSKQYQNKTKQQQTNNNNKQKSQGTTQGKLLIWV